MIDEHRKRELDTSLRRLGWFALAALLGLAVVLIYVILKD